MKKGDIVLIPFPFTDLTGSKVRPALVLLVNQLDIVVAFITSQLSWQDIGDISIQPSAMNGIRTSSLLRLAKLATLDKNLVLGRLGSLSIKDTERVNKTLIDVLALK
jgi:mRNA interferase MazF